MTVLPRGGSDATIGRMIPHDVRLAVERQPGYLRRGDAKAVDCMLGELGVPLDSEFGAFFREYVIALFVSEVSNETLAELLQPTPEILSGTRFVRETWGLPDKYVCLTSCEGEGAYLYDRETGEVVDFELATRDGFLAGQFPRKWRSYFEFMRWYLSGR